MSSTQIAKCPICRRPYRTYSYYAGDQSACPECRMEADRAEREAQREAEKRHRYDRWVTEESR